MRKILFMLFLFAAFCAVSVGGCGGSDSSDSGGSSEPVPADWTDLTGTWKPVKGYVTYYNTAGAEIEVCTLNTSGSATVDMTVEGAGNLYNVGFSDGEILFSHSSGENQHETIRKKYSEYTGTEYRVSGGKLYEDNVKSSGTLYKVIQFVNNDSLTADFTRIDGNIKTMNANVTFERTAD